MKLEVLTFTSSICKHNIFHNFLKCKNKIYYLCTTVIIFLYIKQRLSHFCGNSDDLRLITNPRDNTVITKVYFKQNKTFMNTWNYKNFMIYNFPINLSKFELFELVTFWWVKVWSSFFFMSLRIEKERKNDFLKSRSCKM